MAEKKLKEAEVQIGKKVYEILPVKMKYIKNNFYSKYKVLKDYGLIKLFHQFTDSEDVLTEFLKAIFDLEELPEDLMDNLTAPIVNELVEKTCNINDLKEENNNSKNAQGTSKEKA